jgi:hypothetical protein
MGGNFYVKDRQVDDKLHEIDWRMNAFYDRILNNAIIKEDWDTESAWVLGRFKAENRQLAQWTGLSKSYARQLLNKLIEAKIIAKTDNGSYELPMYKRKADEGVRPSDIQAIREELLQMREREEEREQREADRESEIGRLREHNAEMMVFLRNLIENPELIKKIPVPSDNDKPPEEKKNANNRLSPDKIISMFYKGIGQQKIGAAKRVKARKGYKRLRADKFTPEEIGYAVQWTLENAENEPYDFSLIEHTISQAMAAREQEGAKEAAIQQREKQQAKEAEQRNDEEEEAERFQRYKDNMPEHEKKRLYENAKRDLRSSGKYKTGFISDILIRGMENELLRERFPGGLPEELEEVKIK